MIKLSAVILTFNEENDIKRCLESIKDVADEIIVLDSMSTDKTESICLAHGGVKFIKRQWSYFGDAKIFATQQAKNDYILSLDADEALSHELRDSILKAKKNWYYDAYLISILNYVGKAPVWHSGWYPCRKIRLFDRRKAMWSDAKIHERVTPTANDCRTTVMEGDILHYSYDSIEDLRKSNKAQQYTNQYANKRRLPAILRYPKIAFAFFQIYFIRLGFLDGRVGYEVARARAKYVNLKYS